MFTDIVGYTALMGEDERLAFELLKKNRSIQRPIIEKFNGRWIKEIGDGVLVSFSTVSDAVYCAATIQKSCEYHPDLNLRIGIHLGEVVFEGDDVFGDGVNIASRLEPLAPVGGMLVSESVYNNLINKKDVKSSYLGEKQLKNVKKPVKVYQVHVGGVEAVVGAKPSTINQQASQTTRNPKKIALISLTAVIALILVYFFYLQSGEAESEQGQSEVVDKSIAVIPFVNLSNKDEDLFMTDGVMTAIHNHLSRIGDLSLRSTTSSAPYRNSLKSIVEIGQELEVSYVMEGSFQKVGDMALLLVKLIDTQKDSVIWSEEYNETWNDIFSVQRKVATNVAMELSVVLNEDTKKGMQVIPTTDMDAYDLYLTALNVYSNAVDDYNFTEVEAPLLRAIQLDPDFPLPYILLGWIYKDESSTLFGKEFNEMVLKAKRNLTKAIQLDPYNGWAYSVLGTVNFQKDRDSVAANRNFEKALRLAPNDWLTVRGYYYHQYFLGNCDKIRSIVKQMQKIAPNMGKGPYSIHRFYQLQCEDRYQEIIEVGDRYFEQIVERGHWTWHYLFKAYILKQHYSKARKLLDAMAAKHNDEDDIRLNEAILQARQGQPELALALIQEFSNSQHPNHRDIASLYEALGDEENMYAQLEQSVTSLELGIGDLSTDFYEHQEDLRFQDIVNRSWIPRQY